MDHTADTVALAITYGRDCKREGGGGGGGGGGETNCNFKCSLARDNCLTDRLMHSLCAHL